MPELKREKWKVSQKINEKDTRAASMEREGLSKSLTLAVQQSERALNQMGKLNEEDFRQFNEITKSHPNLLRYMRNLLKWKEGFKEKRLTGLSTKELKLELEEYKKRANQFNQEIRIIEFEMREAEKLGKMNDLELVMSVGSEKQEDFTEEEKIRLKKIVESLWSELFPPTYSERLAEYIFEKDQMDQSGIKWLVAILTGVEWSVVGLAELALDGIETSNNIIAKPLESIQSGVKTGKGVYKGIESLMGTTEEEWLDLIEFMYLSMNYELDKPGGDITADCISVLCSILIVGGGYAKVASKLKKMGASPKILNILKAFQASRAASKAIKKIPSFDAVRIASLAIKIKASY